MKITIHRGTCIGCGVCETLCPDVFELDIENIAIVKEKNVNKENAESVQEAADSCPVNAIAIE